MGTQRDHLTEITAERTESWRDTLAAEHEVLQAGPRIATGGSVDGEEFI